ncbi:hypothetical protein E2320_012219 [Naja naja]|nr:hypothetical protein E2320_012219 [Naja naja]
MEEEEEEEEEKGRRNDGREEGEREREKKEKERRRRKNYNRGKKEGDVNKVSNQVRNWTYNHPFRETPYFKNQNHSGPSACKSRLGKQPWE